MPIVMCLLVRGLALSMSKEIMVELSAIDRYIIDKVKELRTAKGYSQEHLSGLIGKAEGYIGNVESPKEESIIIQKYLMSWLRLWNVPLKNFGPKSHYKERGHLRWPLFGDSFYKEKR